MQEGKCREIPVDGIAAANGPNAAALCVWQNVTWCTCSSLSLTAAMKLMKKNIDQNPIFQYV